jgi:hypothetical protein
MPNNYYTTTWYAFTKEKTACLRHASAAVEEIHLSSREVGLLGIKQRLLLFRCVCLLFHRDQ